MEVGRGRTAHPASTVGAEKGTKSQQATQRMLTRQKLMTFPDTVPMILYMNIVQWIFSSKGKIGKNEVMYWYVLCIHVYHMCIT